MSDFDVEVLFPVHNEGASIAATLREWYAELGPRVRVRFVVVEDGSVDNTKEVLSELSRELPMRLEMSEQRLGYAGAVVNAFRFSTAPWVLSVDSDGQCDPADFWQFWDERERTDVQIGWRVERRDTATRKMMSGAFGLLQRVLFRVSVHDPSCPYLLIPRRVLDRLLPRLGLLTEGFWWEFTARCVRADYTLTERPVTHRDRSAGETVVFRPSAIPRIAVSNGLGLVRVWWQTRSGS